MPVFPRGRPGWTRSDQPRPADDDYETQVTELAAALQWGLFLPRGDQEQRAGGVFSGNDGIDYSLLLQQSGREDLVRAMYEKAGLDLAADLQRLADAPRVVADAAAVDYMRRNFTPTGHAGVPVLSMHTIGDGMTSPSLQRSYIDKVRTSAGGDMIAGLWIERAGHCTQSPAEMLEAIDILMRRIDSGHWSVALDEVTSGEGLRFIDYEATPVPRSVGAGGH